MSNIFRVPADVLTDMLADHKSITGIALTPTDLKREEVIKYFTIAGAISSMLAQGQRIFDDFFPGSSSEAGLIRHLQARQLSGRIAAHVSIGTIRHTGVNGTVIGIGAQLSRDSDGSVFVAITTGPVTGGHVDVTYQSVQSGANQNLSDLSQTFTLLTSISGADTSVQNTTQFINGRDLETPAEMLARIEAHDQGDNTGGNLLAYETWAKEASGSVVTARAIKDARGANTVNTVITSGTTDIEGTVRSGGAVTRIPGGSLITTVQAYILARNPTTDDHLTVAPTEEAFNTTIRFDVYDATQRTAVANEITLLWKIFVYEMGSSDQMLPTELERRIDASVGHLLKARRVETFGGSDNSYTVPASKLETPGVLTLTTMAGL